MRARLASVFLPAALLFGTRALAATTVTDTPPRPASPAPAREAEHAARWALGATAYVYFVPNNPDYVQPTVTADHGALHLEARFNYEELLTGSAWVGYNWSGGDELWWALTPILGGVFGRLNGIAPGYKGSLGWWKLELYSEGEYVFDFAGASGNFFFNWSELTLAPLEWFRFGIVVQRTRAYATDREVQPGLLAGFSYEFASLTAYVLNPDESKPVVVLAAGVNFEL